MVDTDSGCLRWQGPHFTSGYGRVSSHGLAHRIAWEREVGPIPEGLTLDHVAARGCRWKDCVAIAHLEPVTQAENSRRAPKPHGQWTHCRRNHEFTPENTYITSQGSRQCQTCRRERRRKQHV